MIVYNNNDEDVILDILKIQKNEKEKELFLQKYGYYLSESYYKIYFNKPKKNVLELFKELFNLFENLGKAFVSYIGKISLFVEEFCYLKEQNIFTNELNIYEELFFYFLTIIKNIAVIIHSKKLMHMMQM